MIIAKIGDTSFKLDNLKDAETLLNICSKAERLENTYDENYQDYYYPAEGKSRITVEITTGDTVVSIEDHQQKKAAKAEKERIRAEAAKAAKETPQAA